MAPRGVAIGQNSKTGALFGQIFQSRLSLKSKKWNTSVKNFQSTPRGGSNNQVKPLSVRLCETLLKHFENHCLHLVTLHSSNTNTQCVMFMITSYILNMVAVIIITMVRILFEQDRKKMTNS